MNTALQDCQDFARRVRRRMALARAARRVLLSLAISGGAAVVAMAITTMLGRPALPAMGAIILAGLFVGLAWALWRMPGTIAAAQWIDRQLRLSDLLTTALTQGNFNDPAWAATLEALAAAPCRQHQPADVPVMSPPRWTAAAVTMELALVISLGMFFTPAGPSDQFTTARESADQLDLPQAAIRTVALNDAISPRPAGDSNLNEQRNLGNTPESTQTANDTDSHSASPKPNPHTFNQNPAGNSQTSGSGTAVTDTHHSPNQPHETTATGSPPTPGATPATGGTGLADPTAAGNTTGNPGGTVTPGQSNVSNGNVSPIAVDADTAIRAGRVPAEDIDLVRDFFQPGQR